MSEIPQILRMPSGAEYQLPIMPRLSFGGFMSPPEPPDPLVEALASIRIPAWMNGILMNRAEAREFAPRLRTALRAAFDMQLHAYIEEETYEEHYRAAEAAFLASLLDPKEAK